MRMRTLLVTALWASMFPFAAHAGDEPICPEVEVVIPAEHAVHRQVSPFFVESSSTYVVEATQEGATYARELRVVLRDVTRDVEVASYYQPGWMGQPQALLRETLEPGMYVVTLTAGQGAAPLSLRVYAVDAPK